MLDSITQDASLILLSALGFYLYYAVVRVFSLITAVIYVIPVYVVRSLAACDVPLLISLPLSLAAGGLVGVAGHVLLVRPLRIRSSGLEAMMATLGVFFVVRSILSIVYGPEAFSNAKLLPTGSILGLRWATAITLLTATAAGALVLSLLAFTRLGVLLRAIASEPNLARSLHLPIVEAELIAALLSGVVSALFGFCYGLDAAVQPGSGFAPMIIAIAITLLVTVIGPRYLLILPVVTSASKWCLVQTVGIKWSDLVLYISVLGLLSAFYATSTVAEREKR